MKHFLAVVLLGAILNFSVVAADHTGVDRYRTGGKIMFDSSAQIADEDGVWSINNAKFSALSALADDGTLTNFNLYYNGIKQVYWTADVLQLPGFTAHGNAVAEGFYTYDGTNMYNAITSGGFFGLAAGLTNAAGQLVAATNDCATINRLTLTNDAIFTAFTNYLWAGKAFTGLTNAAAEDTDTTTNTFGAWLIFTNAADGKRFKIRMYPDTTQ
jgi:hypothetical protein